MSTNNKQDGYRSNRHRSVFFPVLLILAGAFFLLSNLNMIPGNAGTIFIRFWPVLFMIGALDDLLNQKWVGAVMNFGLGSILLLANLGYFSLNAWQLIIRLWPVFIIAIGLDVIFRGQSVVGSLIGVTISILVLGGLVWFAMRSPIVGESTSQNINFALQGANQADVYLNPAVGDLRIDPKNLNGELIAGTATLAKEENLSQKYDVVNKTGKLSIASSGTVVFFSTTAGNGFPWTLTLNDNIPMMLNVDQGVGRQMIDLDGLNLSSFDVSLGVGSATITLPTEEKFEAKVECAIGEITINVPAGLSVKIKLDTAISGLDYPSNFVKDGDWLYSPDAVNDNNASVLDLSNPIGMVRIQTLQ